MGGFTDASFKKLSEEPLMFSPRFENLPFHIYPRLNHHMVKGVNALRCAVVNAGDNAWNFIAAAWWAAYQFGQEGLVEDGLDVAWPYICTCNADMDYLSYMMGATGASVAVFDS